MITGTPLQAYIQDDSQKAQLTLLEDAASDLWAKDAVFHRYFTIHGVRHSRNILDRFGDIIPDRLKETLEQRECTLLAAAAWVHDLGMLYFHESERPDDLDDVTRVRQTHHIRTEELLLSNKVPRLTALFNDRERLTLGELCRSHGTADFTSLADRWLENRRMRMPLLSSLLRLGDVCDATYQRDSTLFALLHLDQEALPHWAQLKLIDAVSLEAHGDAFELQVHGRVPSRQEHSSRRLVESMAVRWIRGEVAQSRGVLARFGFHIVDVTTDLPADRQMDEFVEDIDFDALFDSGGPLWAALDQDLNDLSPAQRDVIQRLAAGVSTIQLIADQLGFTAQYVRNLLRWPVEQGIVQNLPDDHVALTPLGSALAQHLAADA